ncbi:MAG: hypothetical protein A2855_01395 [Candidatus Liptonbacteria bacterium RIFCSPHIGHO2_01_FULL_57_28]|uniref:CBU-0592-like domain-containing protein n=1 Tax=Candidatus Liptonbacteria bacterium RIFCSPHIGHO2_01_FULL_57_28 TaxID=1798647 RepID=A0A1G2CBB6_9BACT|nr:MAG: hypothetical protein A2855_01395 [Candidatus Liptonbacteria bacterium RIFCSPHIGHO2_01_FULL_57_28]
MTDLLIGIAGATLILLAFVLNELHIWSEDSLAYDVTNFIGGALLVWYAWLIHSWPFVVLNGVWTLVALRDSISDMRRPRA